MQPYKNLGGNSGVSAYEIGDDYIKVEFDDQEAYVYDYEEPGRDHVERMKELAEAGQGLHTYINQYVRERYASKVT